jgi:CRISPR-associated protein Csd1
MLDAVLRYAKTQGWTSEPGFLRKSVKWAIQCNVAGELIGVTPLGDGKEGLTLDRCPHLSQSELIGGGETRSHFLLESLQTLALLFKSDEKVEVITRTQAKNRYFISLLKSAGDVFEDAKAMALILESTVQTQKLLETLQAKTPKPKPTDSAVIFVDGRNPLQSTDWHAWWRALRRDLGDASAQRGPVSAKSESSLMRCVFTGESITPVPTHPKVRGLAGVGGLGTGDVIAGFDKSAFQSFGLNDSRNAATSNETATAYAEALSRLIADHSVKLGDVMAVYWFGRDRTPGDDPIHLAIAASGAGDGNLATDQHAARRLLQAIKTGERENLLRDEYHALVLSGMAGRVMVRQYLQGRFELLAENVCAWFDDLAIAHREGKGLAAPPKFMAVIGGLFRELSDAPAPFITLLWLAAIDRKPIPIAALSSAVMRTRVDVIQNNTPNHARMGLIRAYHVRNLGDTFMSAYDNPQHPSAAYQCGRLLALLARLQFAAQGDVGAGVVQRYYSAVSQAPALHLGRIMANAKNHLSKLDGALAYWFEKQISDICGQLGDSVPRTLSLEEQSLFALGYYQKLAKLREGRGKTPDVAAHTAE